MKVKYCLDHIYHDINYHQMHLPDEAEKEIVDCLQMGLDAPLIIDQMTKSMFFVISVLI